MKNIIKSRCLTGLVLVTAIMLLSRGPACAQAPHPDDKFPAGTAKSITVVINLAMPDGRMMIYSGIRHGLRRDIIYEVFHNGSKLGEMRFEKVTDSYSVGKIVGDPMRVFLEGKAVTLVEKPGTGPVVRYEPVDPNVRVKKLPPVGMPVAEKQKTVEKPSQAVKPPPQRPPRAVPPPPPPPTPPAIRRSSSFSLRYETHSSDSYPDYAYTLIASTSRKTKNHLTSLYALHRRNDHGAGDSFPNSWGGGLSRTWFLPESWYFTAGYNYSRRQNWYFDLPRDNETDSVSASFFKIIPLARNNPDFYKLSFSYYAQSDFKTGEAWSGSLSYTHKTEADGRIALSWIRSYSTESKRYLYDLYGADYTFPVGVDSTMTLGYRFLDTKKYKSGYDPEDDESFRVTLTRTVK